MTRWNLLFLFLSFALSTSAVVSPVCTQFPYNILQPLATFPPAQSFCSAKYPLPPCTSSVTATSTQTKPPVTVTVTAATATITITTGTATVTSTVATNTATATIATITATATTGTDSVTVITKTGTTTVFTATVTVTVTTNALPQTLRKAKRTASPEGGINIIHVPARSAASKTLQVRNPTTTPSPNAIYTSLFNSLTSQAALFVKTACSCIETQPPCTTSSATVTATVGGGTSTVLVTATATTSVQATVTTSVTSSVTVSVSTTTTVSVAATTTISVGTTTTVSTITTSTTYVILPTPACNGGIQRAGGTFNCEFNVVCGQRIVTAGPQEVPVVQNGVTTEAQCLRNCSDDPVCNAFNFDGIANVCTLYEATGSTGGTVSAANDPYSDYGTFTGNC